MRTAAIFTTRAFNSDFTSLFESMHFLREYDRLVLVHAYKTDKVRDFIEQTAKIKIDEVVHTSEWFDRLTAHEFNTWRHFYEAFDPEVKVDRIDDVYLFGAPLSDGGHLKRKSNGLQKNLDNDKFITFVSVAKHYFTAYAAIKVANLSGAPLHEICYDPGENSVGQLTDPIRPRDVHVYHGYDVVDLGIEKHRFYQDGLKVAWKPNFFEDIAAHRTDLVFGYSYMNKERKKTHEYVQEMMLAIAPHFSLDVCVKNKVEGYDTSVPRNDYLRKLYNSRFTLVAPAYQAGCFSPFRYIEALHYGCLPLVLDTCNWRPFADSYDVDVGTFESLVVNKDDITGVMQMKEETRVVLIDYLSERVLNFW